MLALILLFLISTGHNMSELKAGYHIGSQDQPPAPPAPPSPYRGSGRRDM